MEEIKNIIKIEGAEVRTGYLPNANLPEFAARQGNITAPGDYFDGLTALQNKNENYVDPVAGVSLHTNGISYTRALVSVDMANTRITLETDIYKHLGHTTISGQLNEDNELNVLGINSQKIYTTQELAQVIRFNRLLFSDVEKANNLAAQLAKFKASVTQELENQNEFKGQKRFLFDQKVEANFDLKFTLECPVWEGEEAKKFEVEILYDIRDKAVALWLQSIELKEIKKDSLSSIMDREVKRLKPLTVIYS